MGYGWEVECGVGRDDVGAGLVGWTFLRRGVATAGGNARRLFEAIEACRGSTSSIASGWANAGRSALVEP